MDDTSRNKNCVRLPDVSVTLLYHRPMSGNGATWVEIDEGSPFPLSNLPYGVFSPAGGAPRVGVAIGSSVFDLAALAGTGLLPGLDGAFAQPSLNGFLAHGPRAWTAVRER